MRASMSRRRARLRPGHEYILSNAARDAEKMRLNLVDEQMGPTTARRIEGLGIAEGWKCLEVGAGAGGVARWMADRVGTAGSVTAIDRKPLFKKDSRRPQLKVQRKDFLQGRLDVEY